MFKGIPIIGLSGGIGSGKSFVAQLFAGQGCTVIDSDHLVRSAYEIPELRETLRQWWGDAIFKSDGQVNRRALADRIFDRPADRRRLEQLLHPLVAKRRIERMNAALSGQDLPPRAFIWDSPLLFETELSRDCDAVVFVDTPLEIRQARVAERGWTAAELARRENSQMGLDNKRRMSNYSLVNTADAEHVRNQVRQLLPRIIEK